jgi:hypothetical protein
MSIGTPFDYSRREEKSGSVNRHRLCDVRVEHGTGRLPVLLRVHLSRGSAIVFAEAARGQQLNHRLDRFRIAAQKNVRVVRNWSKSPSMVNHSFLPNILALADKPMPSDRLFFRAANQRKIIELRAMTLKKSAFQPSIPGPTSDGHQVVSASYASSNRSPVC